MAKVPVGLRELYETDDDLFLMYAAAVVERTIDIRAQAMREAKSG